MADSGTTNKAFDRDSTGALQCPSNGLSTQHHRLSGAHANEPRSSQPAGSHQHENQRDTPSHQHEDQRGTPSAEPDEFPFTVRPCSAELRRRLATDFGAGFRRGLVRTNHWGFLLQGHVDAARLQSYRCRPLAPGDVWVVSVPKSGTTWTQELVWLLANDLDYAGARSQLSPDRWEFLERGAVFDPCHVADVLEQARQHVPDMRLDAEDIFSLGGGGRRFVQSHLPLSLSPPDLLDRVKVVYVARNPKDVVVSYFNHMKLMKFQGFEADFATFFEYFIRGEMIETPFFPHVLEAWNMRRHPNMCFIFFEDMKRDLRRVLAKVAAFLGKSFSSGEMSKLAEHLDFVNFKRNPYVNKEWMKSIPGLLDPTRSFIRCGETGDWKNHLTKDMDDRMNVWIEAELKGTDIRFVDELEPSAAT